MLVISTSDKGGTGRSVTSCNVAYRRALIGDDVCYLDFDFGSPTSGAIFGIEGAARGTTRAACTSISRAKLVEPHQIDVWAEGNPRPSATRPSGAGRLVLFPGDGGGGEFNINGDVVSGAPSSSCGSRRSSTCASWTSAAGRSHAAEMVLATTARAPIQRIGVRWLVFHRWTRQHIAAASALVYGERGILETGMAYGHTRRAEQLLESIRFVRTVVVNPSSKELRAAYDPPRSHGCRTATNPSKSSQVGTGSGAPWCSAVCHSIPYCSGKSNWSPTTTWSSTRSPTRRRWRHSLSWRHG